MASDWSHQHDPDIRAEAEPSVVKYKSSGSKWDTASKVVDTGLALALLDPNLGTMFGAMGEAKNAVAAGQSWYEKRNKKKSEENW